MRTSLPPGERTTEPLVVRNSGDPSGYGPAERM
jgi:hypothetical protein